MMPMSEEAVTRVDTSILKPFPDPCAAPAQHATADYIMELSGQLSHLADAAGLDLLSYLLEMVQVEAKRARKRSRPIPD